jgi:hypothetical protein
MMATVEQAAGHTPAYDFDFLGKDEISELTEESGYEKTGHRAGRIRLLKCKG